MEDAFGVPIDAVDDRELEGIGKIESGSDGEVAWENNAMQGPRVKQGVEKADAFRDATFNAALYWRKLYTKAETVGTETVTGHECYKVVLTPLEGNPTSHFYDKKSGLLIKTAAKRTTQMGEIEAEGFVDDYRPEGDVVAAHKLTNKFAGQEILITVEKVEFNSDLAKDRFDLPDEVKAKDQIEAAFASAGLWHVMRHIRARDRVTEAAPPLTKERDNTRDGSDNGGIPP